MLYRRLLSNSRVRSQALCRGELKVRGSPPGCVSDSFTARILNLRHKLARALQLLEETYLDEDRYALFLATIAKQGTRVCCEAWQPTVIPNCREWLCECKLRLDKLLHSHTTKTVREREAAAKEQVGSDWNSRKKAV